MVRHWHSHVTANVIFPGVYQKSSCLFPLWLHMNWNLFENEATHHWSYELSVGYRQHRLSPIKFDMVLVTPPGGIIRCQDIRSLRSLNIPFSVSTVQMQFERPAWCWITRVVSLSLLIFFSKYNCFQKWLWSQDMLTVLQFHCPVMGHKGLGCWSVWAWYCHHASSPSTERICSLNLNFP